MPATTIAQSLLRNLARSIALSAAVLLTSAGSSAPVQAQATPTVTVNLTAQRMSKMLPDGKSVPMWGYCSTGSCSANWTPGPTITVPTGSGLTINLSNKLPTPTSLVILGQIGGNLGNPAKFASPAHQAQTTTTWPNITPSTFTPPAQGQRARSFGTEAPVGGVAVAYTWSALKPGTYLYATGTHPSIQQPMGLYGLLVVTAAPVTTSSGVPLAVTGITTPGLAYPTVAYDADAAFLFSEIDPVQNQAVDAVASPLCPAGICTGTLNENLYPAAVNYAPTYFLINGNSFDVSAPGNSTQPIAGVSSTGNVLLRFANAGLRTHVPAVVGAKMALVAMDGNVLPGNPGVQTEALLTAGKTYDAVIMPPASGGAYVPNYFPVFDRQLSLSTGNMPNGGMIAYLQIGTPLTLPPTVTAKVVDDVYSAPLLGAMNGNVRSNDIAVPAVLAANIATKYGNVVLNADGSFVYTNTSTPVPLTATAFQDSFTYSANPAVANAANALISYATVTLNVAGKGSAPTAAAYSYTTNVAGFVKVPRPGALTNAHDGSVPGFPLTPVLDTTKPNTCGAVFTSDKTGAYDGSFTATLPTTATSCSFNYFAKNSQGTVSPTSATVTVQLPAGLKASGIKLAVVDAQNRSLVISDYRWTIEEDTTFHTPPGFTPPLVAGTPTPSLATSFHKSYMPVVATGCTGPVSCGQGQTIAGVAVPLQPQTTIDQVALDPAKYYFVSVMPGDGANAFTPTMVAANNSGGHTMGGVAIPAGTLANATVTALVEPNPLQPAQLSVFIFEDNAPTNNDPDSGEPGLGGFEVIIVDVGGRTGDPVGQMTYDAFNMPLTNALLGMPGCPDLLSQNPVQDAADGHSLIGVIYTCPDGIDPATGAQYTLAGQALVKNLMPGRFDVIARPGADRAGETWYQVSTLEGTPGQDAFAKSGEPAYFQEFGPPGFHTFIGFLNPDHINAANAAANDKSLGGPFNNSITGTVTNLHMSRPVEETLWDSASRAPLAHTTCLVGLNQTTGSTQNIAFAQCDQNGNFTLNSVPPGDYQIVVWDEWLDQIIAFKAVTVPAGKGRAVSVGDVPVFSWFTRVEQSAYLDLNNNGIRDPGEPGIAQIPMDIRFRDGSLSNLTQTDSNGYGTFNELFPLFNWYVTESDTTRFKGTGVNVTVDAGGKPDASGPYAGILNSTYGAVPTPYLPPCPAAPPLATAATSPSNITTPCNPTLNPNSTNRIDPGTTLYEGLMGFIGQTAKIDWGKLPYNPGENGGIQGIVAYYSTRPFDDVRFDLQNLWEPLVPRVTVNLYQEVTLADGSQGLSFIEATQTTSWDDFANGSTGGKPNMQCPGQSPTDPYLTYTLGVANQFKCYDGFHNWNQVQPAVYDGAYTFKTLPDGKTPLPVGKYVVEIIPPPGYIITKEEDKNILIGDAWVAPVTQQFGALANIFILPDQATIGNANRNNPAYASLAANGTPQVGAGGVQSNATSDLGRTNGGLTFPICVGAIHRVPDYLSLFPLAQQVAPFAGADKPLCDRKEVTLEDQTQAQANFFIYTEAHIASHFTGMILDDAASETNAAAPDFGEKFAVPYVPVSIKDFAGVEISRVYADQWGTFNGLTPSSWQVNVPNPAGYSPNMLITCMNDPGPIADPTGTIDPKTGKVQLIVDPQYNPAYSNFCYTNPFMPGMTDYLDTPVLPVAAFASGYNPADCAYPAATPAIKRVDGNGLFGPYIDTSLVGTKTLTITGLGDVQVDNPAYQGPSQPGTSIYGQKKVTRHYGFGTFATGASVALIDGNGVSRALTVTAATWADQLITATVPTTGATAIPAGTYQLVITTAAGTSSIDTATVTIENSTTAALVVGAPATIPATRNTVRYVSQSSTAAGVFTSIQAAINAAYPGDLIMVDEGYYPELVVMWKPVRLQGIGATAVVINAAKYPTNKLEAWRPVINNLFGITVTGPNAGNQAATWQVDPLPGQEVTGGIVLLEPSVLATEEGAGVTVLAKGYAADGVTPLTGSVADCGFSTASVDPAVDLDPTSSGYNPQPGLSNFLCAASRIDGVSVTGGDAGGGIFVNGWAHNLNISNNRVYGNAGAFNGGIRVGIPNLEALAGAPRAGYGFDNNVRVHHNAITKNATVEAPAVAVLAGGGAGGGVSMCSGSDNYMIDHNWVCGNYSASDGGGIGHSGVSMNGQILNNAILFNQSYNQSSTINGGGLVISGEAPAAGTLTNGTGNVLVDANLIVGNMAEAGHGGGIRVQMANGIEVANNPANVAGLIDVNGIALPTWYQVTVSNNMIVNNVAGWSGGGISLADTVNAVIVNNTVANNDSTGIVGALMTVGPTTGQPSPAGIVSQTNSTALGAASGKVIASPILENNIVWHNRSFFFDTPLVAGVATASMCSSNNVADAAAHRCVTLPAQTAAGSCTGTPAYWDLGVLGDSSAAPGAMRLSPSYSILSSLTGYTGTGLLAADPLFTKPYCNGSRSNPGLQFEPGQPFLLAFQLAASATLDEAGNFVDVRFGPLSQTDPLNPTAATTNVFFGNYGIAATSPAVNAGSFTNNAPNHDYYGTLRPDGGVFDIGAVELRQAGASHNLRPQLLAFGDVVQNLSSTAQTVTLTNSGTTTFTALTYTFSSARYARPAGVAGGSCAATLAAQTSCTINIVFTPTALATVNATLTVGGLGGVNNTVTLTGTGVAGGLVVAPTALAFGSDPLGAQSPFQTVTVSNVGTAAIQFDALTGMQILGANPSQYAIDQTSTCANGLAILPGTRCTVVLSYTPTLLGARPANLVLHTSVPPSTTVTTSTVTMTGTGVVATSTFVDPTALPYGPVQIGQVATLTVTVSNPLATPLQLNGFTITGANANNFLRPAGVAGGTCAVGAANAVASGGTCTINLTFRPALAAGAKVATLNIARAGGAALAVPLSGVAVSPALSLTPSPLVIPPQALNVTSAAQVVTLTNTGIGPLAITRITISNGPLFAVSNTCGTSVAAGASCLINVTVHPTTVAAAAATLTVLDAAGTQTVAVTLQATSAASAAVLPTALVFAAQQVSTSSAAQVVTLSNTGLAPLPVTSIAIIGANAADFSQSNSCGTTLLPGVSCPISVSFTPSAAGARTASLRIIDQGGTQLVPLTGTGQLPSATLSSTSFAPTALLASSAPQIVTLSNTGVGPLTINSIALSGVNAADYTMSNNCGNTLIFASSCQISVVFTPAAAGVRSATLTVIYGGALNLQVQSVLNGSGGIPVAALSPTTLPAFANQTIATTSPVKTLTLSNTGTGPLGISGIVLAGANPGDFAQSSTCGASLAAGANCAINVTFTPSAAGARAATLTISDNDALHPQFVVALSGTGIGPVASVSPTSLTFVGQTGTASAAQTITLSNTGTAPMTVNSYTIAGTNAAQFAQSNTCPASLAAGGSCVISVSFTAAAVGAAGPATLTVNVAAPAIAQVVTLSGTGQAPSGTLAPAALAFGFQTVGVSSATQPVTLSNTGIGPLTVAIALGGTNPTLFAQSNNCGASVAVGASCTINVSFTPNAVGAMSATLSAANAGSVSLSGTGAVATGSATPTTLTFASEAPGSTSAAQTVTVSNTGNVPLPIAPSITGANAAMFALTNNCGTSLAVGTATCTISVTFKPTAATTNGAKTATLNLGTAVNLGVGVALTGTATLPTATPNPLAFPTNLSRAASATRLVTVRNAATNGSVTITGTSIAGGNDPAGFTVVAAGTTCTAGAVVLPGATCVVNVRFTSPNTALPPATNRTSTLTIANSASALNVAMTGR